MKKSIIFKVQYYFHKKMKLAGIFCPELNLNYFIVSLVYSKSIYWTKKVVLILSNMLYEQGL